jgi:hypothetical protein
MLSILIPIYNFDVRPLVRSLLQQAEALDVAFELLCLDDGSEESIRLLHRPMANWKGVIYRELEENIGRSRIRNQLAEEAQYPYLLFLDCDSELCTPDFLQQYLAAAQPDRVVVGKRVYSPTPPSDPNRYFRWFYGREREERPAAERNQHPHHAFCTAHFLCPRSIFLSIQLDSNLRQYGHEDTRFGLDLEDQGVPVWHTDNPCRHIDLEPVDEFLDKTRQAIDNLIVLQQSDPRMHTRMTRFLDQYGWTGVAMVAAAGYRLMKGSMEHNFRGHKPSLRLFDIYKLGYYAIARRKQRRP